MDRSSAARRSSFWISTLKRKNQCLKKVSNCICHNNSNPGSLGFNHIFLFPTKDFQKISEKQKGAMRRLWKVLWVKDERGAGGAASQPQEFSTFKLTKCVQPNVPKSNPHQSGETYVSVSLPTKYLLSGIWPAFFPTLCRFYFTFWGDFAFDCCLSDQI